LEFINAIKPKIDNILEYNRINHKGHSLTSPTLQQEGINTLSNEELRNLASLIKQHPDITESTLKQVERIKASNGKVHQLGVPRNTLLKYLDDFKKGKIEYKPEIARAEAERFMVANEEAERLSALAEAERLRAKAEAERFNPPKAEPGAPKNYIKLAPKE
jgi:hypothetical protein